MKYNIGEILYVTDKQNDDGCRVGYYHFKRGDRVIIKKITDDGLFYCKELKPDYPMLQTVQSQCLSRIIQFKPPKIFKYK